MDRSMLREDDPVTRFLRTIGLQPKAAWFGESRFWIGNEVVIPPLRLVYRMDENGVLLLCHLGLQADPFGSEAAQVGAVRALVRLLRRIESGVPEVKEIQGMIVEDVISTTLRDERRRLAHIYESLGAERVVVEGETWMVYRTGGTRSQRRAGATLQGERAALRPLDRRTIH